jgi:hypothetical protein
VRASRKVRHGDLAVQIGQSPLHAGGDPLVVPLRGHRGLDELGLPAGTVWLHHQPPGHAVRDRRAEVLAYQVQAEIESGRAARAGEHVVTVHIEHVRVHGHRGVASREQVCVAPVRGSLPAVEQPCRGERERAGADRHDARAPTVCPTQRRDQCR